MLARRNQNGLMSKMINFLSSTIVTYIILTVSIVSTYLLFELLFKILITIRRLLLVALLFAAFLLNTSVITSLHQKQQSIGKRLLFTFLQVFVGDLAIPIIETLVFAVTDMPTLEEVSPDEVKNLSALTKMPQEWVIWEVYDSVAEEEWYWLECECGRNTIELTKHFDMMKGEETMEQFLHLKHVNEKNEGFALSPKDCKTSRNCGIKHLARNSLRLTTIRHLLLNICFSRPGK